MSQFQLVFIHSLSFFLHLNSAVRNVALQHTFSHGYLPFKNTYSQHVSKYLYQIKTFILSNTFYTISRIQMLPLIKIWGGLSRLVVGSTPPHSNSQLRHLETVLLWPLPLWPTTAPLSIYSCLQFSIIVIRFQSLFLVLLYFLLFWV